jgi:hypothetical protein
MYLTAIAHTESMERRARLIDLRVATSADTSGFDDALRKIDAATERMKDGSRG